MKPLRESVGETRARRIFFPGVFAAVGLHPYIASWVRAPSKEYFEVSGAVLLIAETFVFGLLVSSAAAFILFTFEGFTLAWLTRWRSPHHSKKVKRLQHQLACLISKDRLSSDEAELTGILTLKLSDYPQRMTDGSPEWFAERPTLLGNIIATYELYPRTRYGIDGVAFWNHLMYLAPEPAREDFAESVDFAESLALTSGAGILVALGGTLTLFGFFVGDLVPALALVRSPVPEGVAFFTSIFGLAVFFLFYQFSLPAYREVGRAFRAMVDLAVPAFSKWLQAAPTKPPAAATVEASRSVRQYLDFLT